MSINGLVHYWSLNEASGATVADSVGGIESTVVHDDAAGSDTVVAGWLGNARDLSKDGASHGYIKVFGDTPDRDYALPEWTLGVSFYLPSEATFMLYPMVAWFGDYYAEGEYVLEVVLYPWSGVVGDPPDTIYVDIYQDEALIGAIEHQVGQPLTDGWHQILIVADEDGIRLLLDGADTGTPMVDYYGDQSPVVINMPLLPKIDEAWVGGAFDSDQFPGIVDELQIWDRPLSEIDAQLLWNGGVGTAAIDYATALEPPATAWWDSRDPATDSVYFVVDVIDNAGVLPDLRLPVSSCQATLQSGARSNYAQAVVPAATDYVAQVAAYTDADFRISVGVHFGNGTTQEQQLVQMALQQRRFEQGPNRKTLTLVGYQVNVYPLTITRTLTGIRSQSNTPGARYRANLDPFLRPGMTAAAGEAEITASWINFYATGLEAYMDVGERKL